MPAADPDARFREGEALQRAGRSDEAALALSDAARATADADPALAMRLSLASRACASAGLQRDAAEHLTRLVAMHPGDTQSVLLLAQTRRLSGDLDGARDALELLPPDQLSKPGPAALHADILDALGRSPDAVDLLRPHVDARARSVALATTFARIARDQADDAESYIRDLLAIPGLKNAGRSTLLFRLGSMLEARRDFGGALDAYSEANTATGGPDTSSSDKQRTREIIRSFTADFFADAPIATTPSRAILVVGMPRSGTTLLERTIAAHPDAAGAGELPTLTQIALSLPAALGTTTPYPACVTDLTPEASASSAARYADTISAVNPDTHRVVDKMPHNFMHLGLAAVILTGAPIVHVRRNPMDTCLSCFSSGLGPNHTYARTFDRLAAAYAQYLELMDHWADVLPDRIIETDYEALATRHVVEAKALLARVGLGWDDACARPQDAGAPVTTLSVDQIRRPVSGSSVGRASRFGELLDPLREALASRGVDPGA